MTPEQFSEDNQIFVRLDLPPDRSSRFAERIEIKGWFVPPESFEAERNHKDVSVNLLIEEFFPQPGDLRTNVDLSSFVVEKKAVGDRAYLESLNTEEQGRTLGNYPFPVTKPVYDISGVLNVKALMPAENSPTRVFYLRLIVNYQDRVTLSNGVLIALPTKETWEEPHGGLTSPGSSYLRSDFLVIQGWALKMNDPLKEVTLELGGVPIAKAQTGIWSPDEHRALPDSPDSEACVFSRTLYRDGLEHLGLSDGDLLGPLTVNAKCLFESGESLEINGPQVHWQPAPQDCELRGKVLGEIEHVSLSQNGPLIIKGWVFDKAPGRSRLFLESLRNRVELDRIDPDLGSITWHKRYDILNQFLVHAAEKPYGFCIELKPVAVGRFPGLVRLVAESASGKYHSPIGPKSFWVLLSKKIAESTICYNLIDRGKKVVADCAARMKIQRPIYKAQATESSSAQTDRTTPKRIVFASHNLSATEGAPKVLYEIVRHAANKIDSPRNIVVVSARDGELKSDFEALGVSVRVFHGLDMFAQTWEQYHASLEDLMRVVGEADPEVLYANVLDSVWGVDAAYRMSIPSLWLIHESVDPLRYNEEWDARLRLQFLHRLTHSNQLVFVSETTKALFSEYLLPGSSIVVPNGIDIESLQTDLRKAEAREELSIGQDETVVSIIGTTAERKGQDIFLRGVAKLRELEPERKFRFLIVGAREIDYLKKLYSLREELRLGDIVQFIEETPEVAPYYVASDVLVMASREESAPLVSLEAFGYGVPLVSTSVFGLSEQLRDNENSLTFAVDNPDELATKVARLLKEPDLADRLVSQAKRDLKSHFSLTACVNEHWKLICEAVSCHRA